MTNPSRATKKRRRAKSPGKGCTSRKQAELSQLNLDVLFQIAEYISPMDLLNLARTCKSLRGLLMNKASAFVWRAARRQVDGLPYCPSDLSEPAYANLVFGTQCHGCGKAAPKVLWTMRRRYCPSCKRQRLCQLSSCDKIIGQVMGSESLTVNTVASEWVDKAQMESLLAEHRQCTDKGQFLDEKRKERSAIYEHAHCCQAWKDKKDKEYKNNLASTRMHRRWEIFGRLGKLGYRREIHYFGKEGILDSYSPFFLSPEPLTNQEWDQAWPEFRQIMEDFRTYRLDETVYDPRRQLLADGYKTYRKQCKRTFDLLPHVYDLGHFEPFQNIIMAPESVNVSSESFASAFGQLPSLVDDWRRKLEADLAGVVRTALDSPSGSTPRNPGHPDTVQENLDILHLACALFYVEDHWGAFSYPDVFLVAMCDRVSPTPLKKENLQRTGSIRDRFGIMFLKEALDIVSTCGLDPNIATMDDMDHLNVQLQCRSCLPAVNSTSWRDAMWHAREHIHKKAKSPWKLLNREPTKAIDQSIRRSYARCLLCQPGVGDVLQGSIFIEHLNSCHKISRNCIKRGVHYTRVGVCD